jgi:mycothiol synthase
LTSIEYEKKKASFSMQATLLSAAEIERQFTVRAGTMKDIDAAVELFNASSQAIIGQDEFTHDDLQAEWTQTGLVVENNMQVVLTPEGQMVGYAETWDLRAPYTTMWSWICVHPEFDSIGLAEYLVGWAEQRLRQSVNKAPAGTQVIMRLGTHHNNHAAHAAARHNGMELVRHFFKMGIEFAGPPPAPIWPAGVNLRPFVKGQDDRLVYNIIDKAFEDHWGHVPTPPEAVEDDYQRWRHWSIDADHFDPTLMLVAVDEEGKALGAAVCDSKRSDMPGFGWVSQLGVLREGRGKGIGRALLLEAFTLFYERGYKGCGLGVDAENPTGALKLYESAGMRPVAQWDNYMKILRDGVEYTGE